MSYVTQAQYDMMCEGLEERKEKLELLKKAFQEGCKKKYLQNEHTEELDAYVDDALLEFAEVVKQAEQIVVEIEEELASLEVL